MVEAYRVENAENVDPIRHFLTSRSAPESPKMPRPPAVVKADKPLEVVSNRNLAPSMSPSSKFTKPESFPLALTRAGTSEQRHAHEVVSYPTRSPVVTRVRSREASSTHDSPRPQKTVTTNNTPSKSKLPALGSPPDTASPAPAASYGHERKRTDSPMKTGTPVRLNVSVAPALHHSASRSSPTVKSSSKFNSPKSETRPTPTKGILD
jgi:hypothetical protein